MHKFCSHNVLTKIISFPAEAWSQQGWCGYYGWVHGVLLKGMWYVVCGSGEVKAAVWSARLCKKITFLFFYLIIKYNTI